jgi:hypothetical protein
MNANEIVTHYLAAWNGRGDAVVGFVDPTPPCDSAAPV